MENNENLTAELLQNLKNEMKNINEKLNKNDAVMENKFQQIKKSVEKQFVNIAATNEAPKKIDYNEQFKSLMDKYLKN